jgi:hypothetical protein
VSPAGTLGRACQKATAWWCAPGKIESKNDGRNRSRKNKIDTTPGAWDLLANTVRTTEYRTGSEQASTEIERRVWSVLSALQQRTPRPSTKAKISSNKAAQKNGFGPGNENSNRDLAWETLCAQLRNQRPVASESRRDWTAQKPQRKSTCARKSPAKKTRKTDQAPLEQGSQNRRNSADSVQTDFKNRPVILLTISIFLKNIKIWKICKKLHEILRLVVKKFF